MDVSLHADPRAAKGSPASRRLRRTGLLPAIVYGSGITEPISVSVNRRELVAALSTPAGLNALITLDVNGSSHLTLARELQRDPVRNEILHVDFLAVRHDQAIEAEIPIAIVGVAEATRNDHVVTHPTVTLKVMSLPGNIPESIEVDITPLTNPGDAVRAGDIRLPEGVSLVTDADEVVAAVTAAERVEVEVPEEEEAAAAAAEAAAPAEPEASD